MYCMILEALAEWNHWWKKKEIEIELLGREREELKGLISYINWREIKLISGVRRSGKSTLFYQIINFLLKNKISPEEILLINFEDDVLAKKTLKEIFDSYQSNINPFKKPYIFLDEVHRCEEWILFLRKLYDLKKVKQIFITDSTSKFIKPEYARVITGRNISLIIFPLSFREYLKWKGIEMSKIIDREEINRIKKELSNYLEWGGFPEVFLKTSLTSKKKLLNEYFSDILHKDIVERYNANYTKVKMLADFLVSNATKYFSQRKYSKIYGLSLETIDTYLKYFEEVFLFFSLPKFAYSIRTQQLSHKKIYVCDNGFFNNVGFKFDQNITRVYENIVFLNLKRKEKEIFYWKNKYECDFLIKEGIKIKEAIQVCYELNEENREREIGGLIEAMEKFGLKEGLIITADYESEEKVKSKKIKFMPLWKWILS